MLPHHSVIEDDGDWLHEQLNKIGGRLYDDDREKFIERVGMKVDSNIELSDARFQVFREYYC